MAVVYLKQRLNHQQVADINKVARWRSQRIGCRERLRFLRFCLDYSVTPAYIYRRVKKVRPQFSGSIARAFIKDEIVKTTEREQEVSHQYGKGWTKICAFLSFFDKCRVARLLGENGCRLRSKIRASNEGLLASLRAKRFGTPGGLRNTVSNLSSRDLSQVELEVLSRGPKFGIPPKTKRQFWPSLKSCSPSSKSILRVQVLRKPLCQHELNWQLSLGITRIVDPPLKGLLSVKHTMKLFVP